MKKYEEEYLNLIKIKINFIIMDKYEYFENWKLEKDVAKIIKNDIFLENYSMGEEILIPKLQLTNFQLFYLEVLDK